MSDTVISVQGLGKRYLLGETDSYRSLREALSNGLRRLTGRASGSDDAVPRETLWALKDISFDLRHGEVVGIIGRNGAGKSTLLKIMSRIVHPTEGQIRISGRVASLLEVGTGFHHELTGRENVFLNGAILGMSRSETVAKFDEIVAFAEIERFIDTPVKRYSSGMYMRLAFAVAAHLDPEILVVDEVLAVGDLAFQKKCLGKLDMVARQGRTVLFVSHNMAAVSNLCSRCLLLVDGAMVADGPTDAVISDYCSRYASLRHQSVASRLDRKGDGRILLTDVWLEDSSGNRIPAGITGQDVALCLSYRSTSGQPVPQMAAGFALIAQMGEVITDVYSETAGYEWDLAPAEGVVRCLLPRLPLKGGTYSVNMLIRQRGEIADWVQDAFELRIEDGDFYNTGRLGSPVHGYVLFDQQWTVKG